MAQVTTIHRYTWVYECELRHIGVICFFFFFSGEPGNRNRIFRKRLRSPRRLLAFLFPKLSTFVGLREVTARLWLMTYNITIVYYVCMYSDVLCIIICAIVCAIYLSVIVWPINALVSYTCAYLRRCENEIAGSRRRGIGGGWNRADGGCSSRRMEREAKPQRPWVRRYSDSIRYATLFFLFLQLVARSLLFYFSWTCDIIEKKKLETRRVLGIDRTNFIYLY